MLGNDLDPLHQPPILRDQVYERLESLIVKGILKPGTRLMETELADELAVSRNPVREAITLLAQAGWVDLKPRQGAVVHTPTHEEVEDFFAVRVILEAEAARHAAMHSTSLEVHALRDIIRRGRACVARRDETGTARENSAFHFQVYSMSRNSYLSRLLMAMGRRLEWYFSPISIVRGEASWDEHDELVDAFVANDGAEAARIMHGHALATARKYRDRTGS